MSRVPLIERTQTHGDTRAVLDQVHSAFGGTLHAKLGEQIAVAVADRNACHYCLAAHTALGRKAGASADEMAAAQSGESSDPRTAAALRFALQLVEGRGQVDAAQVQALRDAGFNDAQVVEVIAHVALNLFTNYLNVALEVPVDFPGVRFKRAA
jgi:uncharacterized peroxidase-related enzyme